MILRLNTICIVIDYAKSKYYFNYLTNKIVTTHLTPYLIENKFNLVSSS